MLERSVTTLISPGTPSCGDHCITTTTTVPPQPDPSPAAVPPAPAHIPGLKADSSSTTKTGDVLHYARVILETSDEAERDQVITNRLI